MRRRRQAPPPPSPTPEGHVLVTLEWPNGETALGAIPNELMEADCSRRVKGSPNPTWRDDPSYFWRRGSRR